MTPAASGGGPRWPAEGALRVHYQPDVLPRLGDEPGHNRFDDPRPRSLDRFFVRYAAATLRGCLLELLAGLREDPVARVLEAGVDVTDDPCLVEAPDSPPWQPIADFLDERRVATISSATVKGLSTVSINDPVLHDELDEEPAVRAVLDSKDARAALLPAGASRVRMDNAAVRLASETGRDITQACALALFDRSPPPDAIHYRSRHDDAEDCWAIYDHADVLISEAVPLSPDIDEHVAALRDVADLWSLPIPPQWQTT